MGRQAFDRRQLMGAAGLGITTSLLPAASRATSNLDGSGAGTFSPVLSSLGTAALDSGVSSAIRNTFIFETVPGGPIDAVVWQFDPSDDPPASRSTPRVSIHLAPPSEQPTDGSASANSLGVCVPVAESYDAALHRITLVAPSPVQIPPGAFPTTTMFWLQFYATSGQASLMLSAKDPNPYVPSDGNWMFRGLDGPEFDYGPTVAIGTYS